MYVGLPEDDPLKTRARPLCFNGGLESGDGWRGAYLVPGAKHLLHPGFDGGTAHSALA